MTEDEKEALALEVEDLNERLAGLRSRLQEADGAYALVADLLEPVCLHMKYADRVARLAVWGYRESSKRTEEKTVDQIVQWIRAQEYYNPIAPKWADQIKRGHWKQ